MKSSISDDAHCSKYFVKYKKRPSCPYCGSEMHYHCNIYYEGRDEYWGCVVCGCICPNWQDFTLEERRKARRTMRAEFKEHIKKLEDNLAQYQEKLKLWGKYMTDEEKVELLADELDD